MKEFDVINICPYTGLRSFTEEESLYFKGRDLQVDQVTALLEQNKFLMVTGASGEGKSSLIYAGLIPNARAGFFKAKYTNWVVADFRPERMPITNMANGLAEKFTIPSATIETELRRGFSSLVDLYTNSEYYTDEDDDSWKQLTDQEKKDKKRKAANLMIIVDQFEEFFTNPENFFKEAPSQDSQIVVNLILETARIAIRKNLPIYVVCTMRSDYIGQCSAFRGLPEYIGFSQFFVPRLKRKDLKQVIEEPAILSGNRISQRLIERLVYDIAEGVDQLPILQHALSQVWRAASQGQEEMDLIHYAMVGGMPADELPDEDQARFQKWFAQLPEYHKEYYTETGLGKVIEIHASVLYENAWEDYNKQHPDKPITQQDAKRIIALAFSCLTKIDNSRAVRSRMTLSEITAIINTPAFSTKVVGEVLNIYREDGNSFVRPFILSEDSTTNYLAPDAVLDITHESLIRNWDKLNTWANQEFEFYGTYLDFKKQLDRWKESGKSSDYLLPIGPLTYFENWNAKCKPNAGWIKRYAEVQEDKVLADQHAKEVLADSNEFLTRSARKVAVTRAFMKYGPQRIATIAAMIIMLALSGFYWYDAEQKTNKRVIEQVRSEAMQLIKSNEVDDQTKAVHLISEERYHPGSLNTNLSALPFNDRLRLSIESYKILQYFDKNQDVVLNAQLRKLIEQSLQSPAPEATLDFLVTQANKFNTLLFRDQYYNPVQEKLELLNKLTKLNRDHVLVFYKDIKLNQGYIPTELNMALQLWLTTGKASAEEVKELVGVISPLSGASAESSFNVYYPKGALEPNGRQSSDYNGGFHTLASLYSVLGDFESMEWCFNKLIETNQRPYFELGRLFNNHQNLLGYLYQYNHRELAPKLLTWLATKTEDNPVITVYRNAIIRAGYISDLYYLNVEKLAARSYRGYLFPNLYFADRAVFDAMCDDYEKALIEIKDVNDRNFQLAMQYKRRAMFMHKYWFDRKMTVDESKLDAWLKKSLDYFSKADPKFLEGTVSSTLPYYWDGVRTRNVKMHDLYIYPDYRDGWFSSTYHSDYFYQYLNRNNLLTSLYKTGSDLQAIHFWIAKVYEVKPWPAPNVLENKFPLPDKTLIDILSFVNQHPEGAAFDKNLLILVIANNAFGRGDSTQGLKYYEQVDQVNIIRAYDRYEYIEKTFFLNMMKQLGTHLADIGKLKEASKIVELFSKPEEKMLGYLALSERVYTKRADPNAFVYLDSALSKYKKIDFTILPEETDPRNNGVRLLSRIGSERINKLAVEMLRDVDEYLKFNVILSQVIGVTGEGNFYRARTSIPNTLTETQDLECRTMILLEACKKREQGKTTSGWLAMDRFFDWQWNYIFYLPT